MKLKGVGLRRRPRRRAPTIPCRSCATTSSRSNLPSLFDSESSFVELCDAARRKGRKVGLTASEVERAIFSAACLDKKPKAGAAGAKKRKR